MARDLAVHFLGAVQVPARRVDDSEVAVLAGHALAPAELLLYGK
jgi:hypothetical protein